MINFGPKKTWFRTKTWIFRKNFDSPTNLPHLAVLWTENIIFLKKPIFESKFLFLRVFTIQISFSVKYTWIRLKTNFGFRNFGLENPGKKFAISEKILDFGKMVAENARFWPKWSIKIKSLDFGLKYKFSVLTKQNFQIGLRPKTFEPMNLESLETFFDSSS